MTVRPLPAVLASALALALAACGDNYDAGGAGVYTATPAASAPAATSTGSPTTSEPVQAAGGESADESAEAQPLDAAQRRMVNEASSAARAFLTGYLPYSYGQANAAGIRSASSELRDELQRNPPRVPPAKAGRAKPRVRRLEVSGLDTGKVILLAQVDDGESRYATLVTVNRRADRWIVTEVQ
jgi:hypothetical protein